VHWINLHQDTGQKRAVVNTVTNIPIPKKAGHFMTSCVTISFSGRTLLHGVSGI
jgi:hypothetical protein